jgi:hypothetical protein
MEDLKLEHLWVVYAAALGYPIADRVTALPLREVGNLSLASDLKAKS